MKNSIAVFTCLLLTSFAVSADVKHGGFYMGVDASYETMSVKTATGTEHFGSGSSVILHAGYEFTLSKKYALLFGGTYDIDYYLQGGSGKDITVFTNGSEEINQKIKWGFYVAPSTYLSEDKLIYAKLIYTNMKSDPDGVTSSKPNFSSVGYGIGYRYTFKQDNFINLEWASLPTGKKSFANFKSGADIAPNLSMFTVGWAKKF